MSNDILAVQHADGRRARALGDLRGSAGAIARRRSIRRRLGKARRELAAAERSLGRLADAVRGLRRAQDREQTAEVQARSAPALVMQLRTVNALIVGMAACDALLVSAALQAGYATITPAASLVLAGGIGVALVCLGKKLGERLSTFHRLDDQGARWGVVAALTVTVVAIACVGLTLLRVAPQWSWPFLVLAVPAGSTALTWLTFNPLAAEASRREYERRRAERRTQRADRRFLRHAAAHDAARSEAEQLFRTRLGSALRRAIADGGLSGENLDTATHIADALLAANIPRDATPHELRAARHALWTPSARGLPPPLPLPRERDRGWAAA